MNATDSLTRSQLMLPLLSELHEAGGTLKAAEAIERVSERLEVPDATRNDFQDVDCGRWGVRKRCAWRQKLHWVRMDAVAAGYIEQTGYGQWTLSEKGRNTLVNAQPGVILMVFETANGEAIWADAVTAAGHLQDSSLNLIFSSPPYPILSGRSYGAFTDAELIELIVRCARDWKRALKDDGSLILNFRDVWQKGSPTRSLYQERLLLALCDDLKYHFVDRFIWKNPSHTPESPWVTIKKVRTNLDAESLFALSRTPNPKWDVRRVLVDAKPSTVSTYLRRYARGVTGTTTGPSGQNTNFEEQMAAVAAGQTLKVIPRNVLEFSNADTKKVWRQALEKAGLPRHDAPMPLGLAEFFVKLTTEVGDLIYDPFGGSCTTGLAAENTGRRWMASDRSLAHILGAALRFPEAQVALPFAA